MPVTINGTTGIAGPDGSASTPAVQGTDSNTGLFFPAADTVGVTTGGAEAARINSSGTLILKGGSTSATGVGITFPADTTTTVSSNANTLDDYEEGTWTPAYVFSTSGSVTYNAGGQTGKYTKIGNLVTVKCLLSVATKSSPTGNVTISGLPFTPLNNDDGAGGSIGSIRDFLTITQLRLRTNINFTSIYTETNAPNASLSALQGSNLDNGCRLEFSVTYMAA